MNQLIKQLLATPSDNKHLEKLKADYRELATTPIGTLSQDEQKTHREKTNVAYSKLKQFI